MLICRIKGENRKGPHYIEWLDELDHHEKHCVAENWEYGEEFPGNPDKQDWGIFGPESTEGPTLHLFHADEADGLTVWFVVQLRNHAKELIRLAKIGLEMELLRTRPNGLV